MSFDCTPLNYTFSLNIIYPFDSETLLLKFAVRISIFKIKGFLISKKMNRYNFEKSIKVIFIWLLINLWSLNICVMLYASNFKLSTLFKHQNWKRYCAWYNQRRICSKYRTNHTEKITKHILGGHKLYFKFNVTAVISSIRHQVSLVEQNILFE